MPIFAFQRITGNLVKRNDILVLNLKSFDDTVANRKESHLFPHTSGSFPKAAPTQINKSIKIQRLGESGSGTLEDKRV